VHLQHLAVFGFLLQQVTVVADVHGGVGDDLFTDGVDGRVCDLRKQLFEIIEQRLALVVQHGQRDIDTHGGRGLGPGFRHRQNGVFHILIRVSKRLLQAGQLFGRAALYPLVRDGQIGEVQQVFIQPFAVGLAGGIALFQLAVLDHLPLHGIHQQHAAGFEARFFNDLFRRDVEHPHFGRQDQPPVTGDIVARGAQAVAVQHRPHHVAI